MFSLICGHSIKGKYKGIGRWSHDEVRAHKGGLRIGKKSPKKENSIDVLDAKDLMQKL
jgi:hypothetical protein